MNYIDILIVVPILWGAYKGFRKGFIIEIASLLALFLGIWGGVNFSDYIAPYLREWFNISRELMPLIAFSITFILIVLGVFLIAKLLQKVVSMVALGLVNRLSGMAFGILKFSLILSMILFLLHEVNRKYQFMKPELREGSVLYEPVRKIASTIIPGIDKISLEDFWQENKGG